jgi:serine/threonine protein kinase
MNPLTNNATHIRTQRKAADLLTADWAACEEVIRRFEAAWHAGDSPPSIREHIPDGVSWRGAALQELVQIDLELRRKRGEQIDVDSYLQQFPELRSDASFANYLATANADSQSTAALDLPGFEFVRELGRGGMGVVYLARQTALKRLVAIKMIRGRYGTDAVELARFRTEVEAAARLKHPQIVQLYEVGEHAGQPYCVLEYVAGGSLLDILQGKPQPADNAARLVQQLAVAVQHAHERGVIHRDLKPANILLEAAGLEVAGDTLDAKGRDASTQRDGQQRASAAVEPTGWRPKIADFGLARELTASETKKTLTGMIVGTPAYMSPEQAAGQSKQCGPATDIHALGVLLYELLTGRPPHQGATVLDTLEQIRSQEPVAPRALQPRTPRDLNTICLKCLRKDPARRYITAQALAADLAAYLERRPIAARPVGPAERAWMAARRRPLVASLVAAVCLVTAIGLSVGVYQWRQTSAALSATAAALKNEQSERMAKEAALTKAEEALADTKAFSRFVVDDVLAVARPAGQDGGQGIDTTVREALDAASLNLAVRFSGRPRAEAITRFDLGETYYALGQYDAAETHFREAVRLNREVLGPNQTATMEAEDRLGMAWRQQGKRAEAIALHESLRERSERLKGPNSESTLAIIFSLISDYRVAGRGAEALQASEQFLPRMREAFGARHEWTMRALKQQAELLVDAGRWDEALTLAKEVYEWRSEKLGPEHPATLSALTDLAWIYDKQGRREESLEVIERSLTLLTRKFGPEHPKTLAAMSNVATCYGYLGRFAEAIELDERAVRLARSNLGSTSPDTLGLCRQLAKMYENAGRHSDALPLLEETYKQRSAVLGVDHPSTLESQRDLADAFETAGRYSDATTLAEQSLKGLREKLGDEHLKTISAMNSLALIYKRSGRVSDALPLYQQVVKVYTQRAGPTHPNTLLTRTNLGGALVALGRIDEAIELNEETLARSEKKLGLDHPSTLVFVHNLASTYQRAKRNDEAFALFRRAYEGRAAKLGAEHPDTLRSQYEYAAMLVDRAETSEAERLLRDCHERLAASKNASATLKKQVAAALATFDKRSSSSATQGNEQNAAAPAGENRMP